MASATATWTPSSLQLRLALSSGVRRKSHAVYLRPSRFARKSGCGVVCVSQKPEVDAWTGSDSSKSSADNLAGWDDSGNDNKKSPRAKKKSLIEGVVGAGVAGIILFVGLSYAAASFTKRTKKQEMHSLTSQQESMLQSSDEISSDEIKVAKSEENNLKDEGRSIENNDIVQPGDEGSVEKKKETSSLDGVMPDETDATERIPQNTPEADLMINVEPDLETAESEKIISESKTLLDSSTEPVLLDSESSNLAGAENPTSEDPDSLLNTEPTNVSDLENRVNSLKEDSLSSLYDIDAYGATGTVTEELPEISPLNDTGTSFSTVTEELPEVNGTPEYLAAGSMSSISDIDTTKETESSKSPVPELTDRAKDELSMNSQDELDNGPPLEIPSGGSAFSSAGIPAPFMSVLVNPGKILVPAAADQVQCQAFAALQVLKVIETDTQPSDLCTRREYARWLVSASSTLSRNTISKVYPAMYIENVTEPAFDDVTPEDPDFSSIQGLAEAGLITSKLSNCDLLDDVEGTFLFSPESLLSRQDLISWKMALEKRQLPEADKKMLYELSGFIDIEKINPDAWPAIIADLSTGEQGIAALAFGCTRLFQPHKPVTKGQAAIALSSGEASDIVSEELARIEAESMAEKAVSAHNALVAEVEKDVNASFEKELSMEREKIEAVEKMAELAKVELEQLREKREEENLALVKERAAVESEMEVLSRLRREAEDKLEDLMSKKAEVSFEKERVSNLRKEAEEESQRISKLQYELEVERKALSMARSWAEEEAKRAKEQGRALEEARKRWETNGLRVVVDKDLQETGTGETEQSILLNSVERSSVEETEERAKTLMDKLKEMAGTVGGKSREVIFIVMEKIRLWITILKEYTENLGQRTGEMRDVVIVKAKVAAEEVGKGTVQVSDKVKRMAEECRDGVGKISQRFKT